MRLAVLMAEGGLGGMLELQWDTISTSTAEQANSISIAELATLVTAAGVGIYVLGLIGVALSIRLTFTNSWSTAWYAASLMPRVVVAGQGTRVWRSGMIYVLFLFVFAMVTGALYFGGARLIFGTLEDSGLVSNLGLIVMTLGATALQVYYMVRITRERLEAMPSEIQPRPELLSLRKMIAMAGVGFLISLIAAYVIWRSLNYGTPVFQITVNWDTLAAGALLLLLGVFILGVPLAGVIEHPLPKVRIITKPEPPSIEADEAAAQEEPSGEPQEPPAMQEGRVVRGWLVAHTDSCWHVFVSVNRLDSIPDDRVAVAHVDERPPISATS